MKRLYDTWKKKEIALNFHYVKHSDIVRLRQQQQNIMNNLKLVMPMLQRINEKIRAENIELWQIIEEHVEEQYRERQQ